MDEQQKLSSGWHIAVHLAFFFTQIQSQSLETASMQLQEGLPKQDMVLSSTRPMVMRLWPALSISCSSFERLCELRLCGIAEAYWKLDSC
jgi:hypothetical protein